VLHLLYALNRRLKITSDGSGLKPGLDAYLMKILPPDIQYTMGRATNAVIRTGIIAEQVVESSPDEDPAEAVFESVPDVAVVEEEVVNSVVDDEPVAEESSEEEPVEAVFETVPTASAVEADVETAGENESFDPFSELEADSTGIESKFVQTVTEEDFVDPLIDVQMVEAAAEAAPAEHVFDEEEAPDPFAEMELIDPETEDALADSDTEEEFSETVKIAGSDGDSEEDFTKTVIIKKTDLESGSETEKPAFEQDYISTPAAPNAQKSS
ncbi:MAG: hypothetical protein O6932_08115, partial [Gammaproteobacteria bacterium]|nr:hypothetical protein [Gammaproteobacteria bacterium]